MEQTISDKGYDDFDAMIGDIRQRAIDANISLETINRYPVIDTFNVVYVKQGLDNVYV